MAKDNLFLGMGRGAVGDIVLSRVGGQQVARVRNRSPKNPKSPLQLSQRVIMKTSALAYSLVQDISNHAFQGVAEGTPSQSVFVKRNVEQLRMVVAEEINSGERADIIASLKTNFASAGDGVAPINPYIISDGKLPVVNVRFGSLFLGEYGFYIPISSSLASPTYAELVSLLGLSQGDQLTFCFFSMDDLNGDYTFNGFHFARVILDPSSGDMSAPFLSAGAVNLPNAKNEGGVKLSWVENPDAQQGQPATIGLQLQSPVFSSAIGQANTLVGVAVIASRLVGSQWARSSQSIVLRPADGAGSVQNDYNQAYFGDAVYSFEKQVNSSLYLNQAE